MDAHACGRVGQFGKPQLLFVVDQDLAESVSRFSWSTTTYGYLHTFDSSTGKKIRLHRFVWLAKHGWCPRILDHINGITWDCRLANLRPATASLNASNRRVKRKHDLPRGVSIRCGKWATTPKRYVARIRINGMQTVLGYFESAELASTAYESAAISVGKCESEKASKEACTC